MLLDYMEELRAQSGEQIQMELSDFETFYHPAKVRFYESEKFATSARKLVVELKSGDKYCNKLWHEFNDMSLRHCNEVYERLGDKSNQCLSSWRKLLQRRSCPSSERS